MGNLIDPGSDYHSATLARHLPEGSHRMTARSAIATRLSLVAVTAGLTLVIAVPASAHVIANPDEVPAGGYAVISLRVPHGCDGAATTSVTVKVPDTVASVTPQLLPGWEVGTKTGPLAEPIELHGETVTEGVREITWSGGAPIPDGTFFDFGVSALMPDEAGETLYFPTVQTCEQGETAWIDVPEAGQDHDDLETPAPAVTLTDATETGHDHGDEAGTEATADHSESAASDDVTAELTAAEQPDGGDGLAIAAIVIAGLALLAGLAALLTARRQR